MNKYLKSVVIILGVLIVTLLSFVIYIIIQKYSNSLNKPIENLEIFLKLDDQDDVKSVDIDDNKMYIHIYEKSSGKAIYPVIIWQDRRTGDFCNSLKEDKQIVNGNSKDALEIMKIVDKIYGKSKIYN